MMNVLATGVLKSVSYGSPSCSSDTTLGDQISGHGTTTAAEEIRWKIRKSKTEPHHENVYLRIGNTHGRRIIRMGRRE
jgi:hypothetical protein